MFPTPDLLRPPPSSSKLVSLLRTLLLVGLWLLTGTAARAQSPSSNTDFDAYVEGGAFAEVDADRDPYSDEGNGLATGLGVEMRLGQQLLPFLDADVGGRWAYGNAGVGTVKGLDAGVRLHLGTLVTPYLGLRLGYTHIAGQYVDFESAAQSTAWTSQHALHARPEAGLSVGPTDGLHVVLGVGLNFTLAGSYSARDEEGVPLDGAPPRTNAVGLGGAACRLAVSIPL